jgi:hypothetical protein
MIYARAFFDLQLEFAETVSALSGQPLAETLLDYTNFYIRFALGRGFDPDHPGWREYVAGLREVRDQREWTYRFYTSRPPAKAGPDVTATFGCFAYAPLGPDRVRLHFENNETGDGSPLAVERRGSGSRTSPSCSRTSDGRRSRRRGSSGRRGSTTSTRTGVCSRSRTSRLPA